MKTVPARKVGTVFSGDMRYAPDSYNPLTPLIRGVARLNREFLSAKFED